MRQPTRKMSAGLVVLAASLLLGACASTDSVERAQATADHALQLAQQANQKADAAMAAANAASAKADRMFQQGLRK